MTLDQALQLADEAMRQLMLHCERGQVVGSIRRGCPQVKDIDLLVIPADWGPFLGAVGQLGQAQVCGEKYLRVEMGPVTFSNPGHQVDIYIATPETWGTLLLIRTGSKEHNVRLTTLAKRRGWKLHADGRGLYRPGEDCGASDTEESIFADLGIPYLEPCQREVPASKAQLNRVLVGGLMI